MHCIKDNADKIDDLMPSIDMLPFVTQPN